MNAAAPRRARAGALVVSLDFELHWGVRDHHATDGSYRANLLGAREAIPRLLDLFAEFGVHATWASVGFLFAESRDELRHYSPAIKPRYDDPALSPYAEPLGDGEADDPLHYAPSLVAAIRDRGGHEIASHTFSHYYTTAAGQAAPAFEADLASAVAIARARGITLRSIVFPRNQVNPGYLALLPRLGFQAYRGAQPGWMHEPSAGIGTEMVRRAGRLADAYLPVRAAATLPWHEIPARHGLRNVRGSRFLRPFAPELARLEPLRLWRILTDLRRAAVHGEVFHLWWHPHNFGVHMTENLRFLRQILGEFSRLRAAHGLHSCTMAEAAAASQAG